MVAKGTIRNNEEEGYEEIFDGEKWWRATPLIRALIELEWKTIEDEYGEYAPLKEGENLTPLSHRLRPVIVGINYMCEGKWTEADYALLGKRTREYFEENDAIKSKMLHYAFMQATGKKKGTPKGMPTTSWEILMLF